MKKKILKLKKYCFIMTNFKEGILKTIYERLLVEGTIKTTRMAKFGINLIPNLAILIVFRDLVCGGESSVVSGTLCLGVNQVCFQGPYAWG